ncbi:hypothetical protein [Microlunatus sp. Gsoil 973]|jgi:hypothetical protein|uniref:hypothetical protein n=1 Tax=Microlunatus sp. Gsoil 973 TaxID=2672569 RepID=UPI0012B4C824|nr:hypothetical protein [Microlunatus sp. Gsoil 973]QGN31675.1 hypothetical protein GJV80_01225 [Microlunatus sp. Gsoil 973]
MGYGAFFNVQNNRSQSLRLFVTDVQCMYDNGDQGSNLSLFNNAVVSGKSALPASGTQYIEVKASGGCFFQTSTFHLKVTDDANGAIIGEADFLEDDNNWNLDKNTNPDVINVMINNSGDQARMTVTVAAS